MSEKSRLGGKGKQTVNDLSALDGVQVQMLASMSEAVAKSRRQFYKHPGEREAARLAVIGNRPVDGEKARLAKAVDESEALVEEAIWADNRLAKRAQWKRRDEGEYVCPGLLASGDDSPFFKHTRAVVCDATDNGERIKVVISTDDKIIAPGTVAAFIATARLVQQFVPLDIWWQGSWLTPNRYTGFVSLVPLVQGDMDFSRLEFCLADQWRDSFSWQVMAAYAVLDVKMSWNGCGFRAERSYLEAGNSKVHFVSHCGIKPTGESVAGNGPAQWLGWRDLWSVEWEGRVAARSAEQSVPDKASPTHTYSEPSAEDKRERKEQEARWRQRQKENEAKDKADAVGRVADAMNQ